MNIIVETKNFEKLHTEELKGKCPACLDQLWESQWVRRCITRADMEQAEQLQALGDKIAQSSDVTVVLASGQMAKLLRAGISAAEPTAEKSKAMVFGDTLSPSAYGALLHFLEGKSFSLLAVSEGEESLQFRGAYSVLKQQLISSCGKEQAAGLSIDDLPGNCGGIWRRNLRAFASPGHSRCGPERVFVRIL